ncbi:histidine kinase [Rhizomonospora bruguierae]|uniref:histidine kinase n=1 Tax=Rhizomonospora bruguierae TaxID=1581705 RepID=UPI001BCBDE6B|nr:histidine kinase [Micromonospora sp. NBRC 107566]
MTRALAALTLAAYLTLVIDVVGAHRPALALAPGTAFLVAATLGFEWARRRAARWPAYAYVLALLLLGYAVFVASDVSVGAILLLVVLVSQAVLLLPLPAAAVVVAIVPFFHTGMALADGLREGLGLLAVAVFAAVLTKLLAREQRARADLAEAHAQLREYAVQAERLAAVQERNRVARDIHDGLGHALTVVQMQIKAARAVLPDRPDRADEVLAKAQEQAEEALREVRRSVSALRERRPVAPLPEALRALAAEASAAGVPARIGARPAAPAGTAVPFRPAGNSDGTWAMQAKRRPVGSTGLAPVQPGRRRRKETQCPRFRRPSPVPSTPPASHEARTSPAAPAAARHPPVLPRRRARGGSDGRRRDGAERRTGAERGGRPAPGGCERPGGHRGDGRAGPVGRAGADRRGDARAARTHPGSDRPGGDRTRADAVHRSGTRLERPRGIGCPVARAGPDAAGPGTRAARAEVDGAPTEVDGARADADRPGPHSDAHPVAHAHAHAHAVDVPDGHGVGVPHGVTDPARRARSDDGARTDRDGR